MTSWKGPLKSMRTMVRWLVSEADGNWDQKASRLSWMQDVNSGEVLFFSALW